MRSRKLLLVIVLVVSSFGMACAEEEGGDGPGLSQNPNNRSADDAGADAATDAATDAASDAGDDAADTDMADGSDAGDAGDVEPDVCEPDDEQVCTQADLECGAHDLVDNCGDSRTINCGDEDTECDEYETCGGGGDEGVCGCTPTTCEDAGVLCGEIQDGCGNTLTCTTFCVDELFADYDHSCAVGSGKLKCWGFGRDGRLGTGSTSNAQNPTDVQGISGDVINAAVGERHSCATTSGGEVKCWGDNGVGQLGVGTTVSSDTAGNAAISSGATQVVAGSDHTCAVVNGGVKCWGSHEYGQIGDPAYDLSATVGVPKSTSGLDSGVTQLAAGAHHTCALLNDGTVKCWGRNDYGQLGAGLTEFVDNDTDKVAWGRTTSSTADWSSEEPITVLDPSGQSPLSDIVEIYANRSISCAINSSDQAWCWGALVGRTSAENCDDQSSKCPYFPDADGTEGFLVGEFSDNDDGTYSKESTKVIRAAVLPIQLGSAFTVESMALGTNHLCLLVDEPDTAMTNIYCLGHNKSGQLGDGTTNSWIEPTDLTTDHDGDLVRGTQLVAGRAHSCALVGDNNAKCWGSNDKGQIGNSDLQREQSYQPFDVKLNTN